MNRSQLAFIYALGVVVVVRILIVTDAFLALAPAGSTFEILIRNVLNEARSVAALAGCFVAYRICRTRQPELARAWLWMSLSFLGWITGIVMHCATELTGHSVVGTFVDIPYLLFYPVFLAGVLKLPVPQRTRQDRTTLFLDLAIALLAAFLIVWVLAIRHQVEKAGQLDIKVLSALAYAFGDVWLLWAASYVLAAPSGVVPWRVRFPLALGAVILFVTNLAYGWQVRYGYYQTANVIGLGWSFGLASFAVAGALAWQSSRAAEGNKDQPSHGWLQLSGSLSVVLSFVIMAVAFILAWLLQETLTDLTTMLTLVLILLLGIARQFMGARTVATLNASLEDANRLLDQRVQERTLQLETERDRSAAVLAGVQDGILIHDLEGRILDVNPAMLEMFACSRDHALKLTIADISGPGNPMDAMRRSWREMPPGTSNRFDWTARRQDGVDFPVEVVLVRFDYHGQPALVASIRDMTARHQAEMEYRRLATAMDQMDEDVIITDAQGLILYVNPAFERLTGYARQDCLGRKPSLLKSGRHDDAFYKELWDTLLAGKTWHGRITNKCKDGRLIEEDSIISPITSNGKCEGYVAVKRDVTEYLMIQDQLRRSQRLESIGRLAGGVAHDFNNLLVPILGYAELMLAQKERSEGERDRLGQIFRAAQRARELTQQLLAFGRKNTMEVAPFNLNTMLRDFEKMLRRLIREDISLTMELAEDLGNTSGDVFQIEQVVLNLVVNARDALPTGGSIEIRTANLEVDEDFVRQHPELQVGPHTILSVSDTGVGMAPEVQARLFEPFFTTKEVGQGTGLGLATAFGIVKQHGGAITVESDPGRGSVFRVYLPRVTESVAIPEQDPEPLARGEGTILVVEDHEGVRAFTCQTLKHFGYQVLPATGPKEAFEILRDLKTPVDLLLSDVVMPEMDGMTFCLDVRKSHPELRVLLMSAYASDVVSRLGVVEGRLPLIQKPFSVRALISKVQTVMASPVETEADPSRG